MRFGTFLASMFTLALAVAATACAQSTRATPATPATPAAEPTPAVPPTPETPQQPQQPRTTAQPRRPVGASAGARSGGGASSSSVTIDGIGTLEQNVADAEKTIRAFDFKLKGGWDQTERPVVITTEPITEEIESEVKEDLTVMDKLLSDEATRAGGGGIAPHAMGIKLSQWAITEPTYIEGLGAMFSYRVGVPLAGGATTNQTSKPAGPPSKWESARRELNARRTPGASPLKLMEVRTELPLFDPDKVEELTKAIIKTLPEAKNMRHLKDGDVVIVTISGVDDAGQPVRMTLKANKSDIDQAASGAITPEAFRERVARRIG